MTDGITTGAPATFITRLATSRLFFYLMLGFVLFAVVINFIVIPTTPVEHIGGDEAGWTNYALTWLRTGNLYYQFVDAPEVPVTPGVGYWTVAYSLWIQVVGHGFINGRIYIWIQYVLGIIVVGTAGFVLWGRNGSVSSALAVACSLVMLNYRIIRPDIGLPFIGGAMLLFYILSYRASQIRIRWLCAFAVGWLGWISLEIHVMGSIYLLGCLGLYGYDQIVFMRREKKLVHKTILAFTCGLGFGALLFMATHVFVYPGAEFYFSKMNAVRELYLQPNSTPILASVENAVRNIRNWSPFEVIVFAISSFVMLLHRQPSAVLFLRFTLFSLIVYAVMAPSLPGTNTYPAVLIPYLALSSGWLIATGLSITHKNGLRLLYESSRFLLSIAVMGIVVTLYLSATLPTLSLTPWQRPQPQTTQVIGERLRQLSDSESVVIGNAHGYWSFLDYPKFYANETEYEVTAQIFQRNVIELWRDLNADMIFYTDNNYFPQPPKLQEFLVQANYHLVDEFTIDGVRTRVWWRSGYTGKNDANG